MKEETNEELRGEWWLPDEPSNRAVGTLQISSAFGPQLSLDGPLGNARFDSIPLLHGAASGQEISVLNLRPFAVNFLDQQELVAGDAVVGTHVESDATFAQAALEFDLLTEWMSARALTPGVPNWKAAPGAVVASVSYTAQPINEVEVTSEVSIRLRPFPGIKYERGKVTLEEEARFEVAGSKLRPSDIAAGFVAPFQDFLAFATSHAVAVTGSWLRSDEAGEWFRWHRRWRRPRGDLHEVRLGDILFRRSDLGHLLDPTLRRWWATKERLRGCLDLLISLLYGAEEYTDTELLLVAQAVEAYHRGMYDSYRWPPNEFSARKASVLNRFTEHEGELRDWLESLLEYANEPTLASRLTDVVEKARLAIPQLLDRIPDWGDRLRKLRNAYTHRGAKPIPYSGAHIRPIIRVSMLVIQACILLDLGLDAGNVGSLIQRTNDYALAMSETRR